MDPDLVHEPRGQELLVAFSSGRAQPITVA